MTVAARVKSALWSPLLPFWLVIFLLPVGRSSELGTLLCLVGTIALFVRAPHALKTHRGARLLLWLWAAYRGAALISAPDALEAGRSWLSMAGYIRYVPLGLYACFAIRSQARLKTLVDAVAVVVALWTLDAWVQAFTGWSLGGQAQAVRVTGIFGADDIKLGSGVAVLASFGVWGVLERWGWRG